MSAADDDYQQCLRDEEEERAEQRAKLFLPVGEKVDGFVIAEDGEDGPQLVEEIESLCMNCEENVSTRTSWVKCIPLMYRHRVLLGCF